MVASDLLVLAVGPLFLAITIALLLRVNPLYFIGALWTSLRPLTALRGVFPALMPVSLIVQLLAIVGLVLLAFFGPVLLGEGFAGFLTAAWRGWLRLDSGGSG